MRRFKFRLEAVFNQRKKNEETALAELGAAQRALQAEKDRKLRMLQELEQALLNREGLGKESVSVQAFHIQDSFIQGTKQRMIQADQAIFRANKSVEKAMRAYLQARRQTRMIEILREKAYEEFKKEIAKKEHKELDDLIVMRNRITKEESA